MTKETVTIVTLSTEEVQAIRSVYKLMVDFCEDICDWEYDHHYIKNVNNEKRILDIRKLETIGGYLEDLTEFIFDDNKIQIVEK